MYTTQKQLHFPTNGDKPETTGEWETSMWSIPETPADLYQKPTRASPELPGVGHGCLRPRQPKGEGLRKVSAKEPLF